MQYIQDEERELVFLLAEKLTGTCQSERYRRDVLLANVERRMSDVGLHSLAGYLEYALENGAEVRHLISALTIHTTSWFRESPHFEILEKLLTKKARTLNGRKFRLLCAACSTGPEVYSFALLLESYRRANPTFEYEIIGVDIDPVSLNTAKKAIYPYRDSTSIPQRYRPFLLRGTGRWANSFSVHKDIRERCSFQRCDLGRLQSSSDLGVFDHIVCRNVLIYFSPDDVKRIVHNLSEHLLEDGVLCLGHSEALPVGATTMRSLGHSTYQKGQPSAVTERSKILIVDDSNVVRRVIRKIFESKYEVFEAESAQKAEELLKKNPVDLITLDLRMPEIDGPTFLKAQRQRGLRTPVIIVSDAAPTEAADVLGALANGAQEYLEKSRLQNQEDVLATVEGILKTYQQPKTSKSRKAGEFKAIASVRPELIVVGASTGGTDALTKLLHRMPGDCPPVMVVQHITHSFSRAFAERLCASSGLPLGEITDGEQLKDGHLYVALGDYHISVTERGKNLFLKLSHEAPVCRCRPSVDVLFNGAAEIRNRQLLGVLLTGMGSDGAKGLLNLKTHGANTLVQDEASCVVFGMPREAIKLGAAEFVGNLNEIRMQMECALRMPARPEEKAKRASTLQMSASM